MGTMSGGSLMMRRFPSTSVVSFEKACMLSCVRALARLASVLLRVIGFTCLPSWATAWSMSSFAYQTSRFVWEAKVVMALR